MGWLDDKVGVGALLPLSPMESFRIFVYNQVTTNEYTSYQEFGVHLKMGAVYAIIVIVALAYGVFTRMTDLQTALQQFKMYWDSINTCPIP